MFGPHLILEGYNCQNKANLASQDIIKKMLTDLPALMDMTIIMPPQVMHYDGGDLPEDKGVSGFVIIAESHLAIHTFPEKGFFTLDIFSCKEFNSEQALIYIKDIFAPETHEQQIFDRGREFPRCTSRATEITTQERNLIS